VHAWTWWVAFGQRLLPQIGQTMNGLNASPSWLAFQHVWQPQLSNFSLMALFSADLVNPNVS
jgi:hypothetical protein